MIVDMKLITKQNLEMIQPGKMQIYFIGNMVSFMFLPKEETIFISAPVRKLFFIKGHVLYMVG